MNVRTQARSAAQSGAAALHSFLLNAATFLRLAVAWFEMLVGYVAGAGVGTLEGLVRAVQSSRGRQALEGAASATLSHLWQRGRQRGAYGLAGAGMVRVAQFFTDMANWGKVQVRDC